MTAILQRFFNVRAGEFAPILTAALYFFCVLTAYYVVRPVREQLAAAVGSTQLPWFYGATFVVTLLLTPLFAALVSRYRRRVMVPVVYGVFVLCLLAFVPLFANPGWYEYNTMRFTGFPTEEDNYARGMPFEGIAERLIVVTTLEPVR